ESSVGCSGGGIEIQSTKRLDSGQRIKLSQISIDHDHLDNPEAVPRQFLEPRHYCTASLQPADAPLHHVPQAVESPVELRRPASSRTGNTLRRVLHRSCLLNTWKRAGEIHRSANRAEEFRNV